ncbi:MAG: hypothetical protein AAF600_16525 [Bacteroidota bacterium]
MNLKRKGLVQLVLFTVTLITFIHCEDDDGDIAGPSEPNASFPYVLMTQTPGEQIGGYLTAFDSLPSGDIDPTIRFNTETVTSSQGMVTYSSSIYARDFEGNDGVLRYDIAEDGFISMQGFIDGGQRMKVHVVSETKGYYADLEQFNIQIFNPQTMERTGEVDMESARQGGQDVQQVLYMISRDGKLFAGFTAGPAAFSTFRDSAFLAVIDIETDELEAVRIKDGASFLGDFWIRTNPFVIDQNNDIYMTALGDPFGGENNGGLNGEGRLSKVLRIRSGETDFDATYEWDIANELGRPSIMRSLFIASNGSAYTCLLTEDLQTPELFSQPAYHFFELDLANQTGQQITGLPLTAGFGTATLLEIDNRVLFPIVNEDIEFNGYYFKDLGTQQTGVQFKLSAGGRPRSFVVLD